MAYNVFGNPITDATLEGMPQYGDKKITRTDRAHVALNMKNAENKDVNARQYVENQKRQWGTGVSTLCLVYNATGGRVRFITSHDYWGHIGPAPYPVEIANGQWAGFLHVKTSGTATGSTAAIVYRGKNQAEEDCDWMLAWSNPWNRSSWDNTVYTDIRKAGYFEDGSVWGGIANKLYQGGLTHKDDWIGCLSYVSTGDHLFLPYTLVISAHRERVGVREEKRVRKKKKKGRSVEHKGTEDCQPESNCAEDYIEPWLT